MRCADFIPRRRSFAWLLLHAALGALVLPTAWISPAAQAAQSSTPQTTSHPAPAQVSSTDDPDSCSLLEPREVETMLGAPLAVPPFLSDDDVPDRGGSMCKYEDANLHSIRVQVIWEGGARIAQALGILQAMADQHAKGTVHLADGTDLAGEWDEARVAGCCRFMALRGDELVTVDVGGSKASIADAARLADVALRRLDKPLARTGYQFVRAALEFEAARRPKRRDACAFASRADIEALIGTLAGEPKSSKDTCEYVAAAARAGISGPQRYVLKVRWTGGFAQMRADNETFEGLANEVAHSLNFSGNEKAMFDSSAKGGDLGANPAWEAAHYNVAGLSAVKKDVLVTVQPEGGTPDGALKLMERVMSRL